jgi:beta-glucanase (GH16 family)
MRKLSPIIFLALYFFIYGHSSGQNWQLVWSDEFNNGISSDWVFETGRGASGWGNNELQYYRRENATVQNGNLVITAKRENFNGANYTSARMKTQGRKSWKYGKIEARIAMPAFQGVWPAFWMLGDNINSVGWPSCGEIDIMEHVNTGGEVVGTMHWANENGHHVEYGGRTNTNVTDFHIYSIEWNATSIKWFLDGRQYHEASIAGNVNSTHEFHNNFFILLNMAIGGNWPGFSVDNNALPASMYVDYVRVYQDNGTPPPGGVTNLAGTYYLQNRHSGLYMDVAWSGTSDGDNIHQWGYNGNSNQQFEFAHLGNGIYRITARHSGRSLDVSGVSTANGANVQQWGYGGGANQQFIVRDAGNGYYKLVARHSNKPVEVAGFSTATGGNIQQWADDGQLSAHWRLVPVVPAFSTTIQAENFSAMAGVQTEATTDAGGGLNVGYIDNGDWMAYNNINIPSSGTYRVEYRVASTSGGRLSLDLNAGTIQLGSVNIPNTGGWQNWTTVSHNVSINAGTYNVGIYAQTGGWNINWFRITRVNNARTMLADGALPEIADAQDAGQSFESSVTLFPNPAENQLQIVSDYNLGEGTIRIFNSLGTEVMKANASQETIDVSGLDAGIYHVVIATGHYNSTKRFVKK